MLICTCDGTVTGFGLANPKPYGEREQARQMLKDRSANRPAPGTAVVTDKGLVGEETEACFAGWHNGRIGAPVKRSLIVYDRC